ncbi:MAG TPA: hypothetical protein VMS21_00585 [Methylomirabilota bacterium]|nr:hypothetical protein [Methylomirabilota bacterium]
MKSDGLGRHLLIAGAIAAAFYLIAYNWIEYRRNVKGSWQATFATEAGGIPLLRIDQPALGITHVTLRFPDENVTLTNGSQTVEFSNPLPPPPLDAPVGKVVFFDTTFLPGTITFEMFGHQVELLPRVLNIDLVEHPWNSGSTIDVIGEGTAPEEPLKRKRVVY